jgi:hypothetical protein
MAGGLARGEQGQARSRAQGPDPGDECTATRAASASLEAGSSTGGLMTRNCAVCGSSFANLDGRRRRVAASVRRSTGGSGRPSWRAAGSPRQGGIGGRTRRPRRRRAMRTGANPASHRSGIRCARASGRSRAAGPRAGQTVRHLASTPDSPRTAGGRSGRRRAVERHGARRTQRLCATRPKVQSLRRHLDKLL